MLWNVVSVMPEALWGLKVKRILDFYLIRVEQTYSMCSLFVVPPRRLGTMVTQAIALFCDANLLCAMVKKVLSVYSDVFHAGCVSSGSCVLQTGKPLTTISCAGEHQGAL